MNYNCHDEIYQIPVSVEGFPDADTWIKIKRNNRCIKQTPLIQQQWRSSPTPIASISSSSSPCEEPWIEVVSKKNKIPKPPTSLKPVVKPSSSELVHYWTVVEHHLMPDITCETPPIELYFCDPDTTTMEVIDRFNHCAVDYQGNLAYMRFLHLYVKYKGIKLTPKYFIAKNPQQIVEALQHIKYCLVRTAPENGSLFIIK